ncbi:hypothetical protein [Nesterenkonia sp.]|uniref:hypothetical protein n=1 Tax=Nesterenkonia sp. TaxID=704201 RepID=UPI00263A1CB6|nr:hypothetical protein [Nesterenkonia sp.]
MTTPTIDAVYPTLPVWQDLRPYLVNGWEQRGQNVCAYKITGNDLETVALLQIGNEPVIAEGLPSLTGGTRDIEATASQGGVSVPVRIYWGAGGSLVVRPGYWTRYLQDGSYSTLTFSWRGPR